ncbi:PspC domain-containing protein [Sanguibacter suaedae]|uniref:PspC domain-containing protein n=1 Tax=Sanguibacter suaedae TaxID=2795737 RepID=A0A934I8G3_9MICO|nr:PspC domain-containing protein [Sanguibacter suaedae]MBI9114125.1 PspC domain-containing protein [Sanguibacter suaedae]
MDTTGSPTPDATHEPPPDGRSGRDGIDDFFTSVRRLGVVRAEDRWVAGVASGVALRLGVDALLVRAGLVLLMLTSGAGFVLYAIAWVLLPEQRDGRIHLEEALRGRVDAALAGAVLVLVVGLGWGPGWFGWWGTWGDGWFEGLFWLALVGFLVYLAVTYNQRRTPGAPGGPAGPAAPAATSSASSAGPVSFTKADAPTVRVAEPGTGPVQDEQPTVVGWSSETGWSGGTAWSADAAAAQKPPTRGAGAVSLGIVLGLGLLVLGVLLLADRSSDLRVSPWATAIGATVVLAGVGIVVAGFRGRSSGSLGFVAVLGLLVGAPAALLSGTHLDLEFGDQVTGGFMGEGSYEPTTIEAAESGYGFGLGDLTIDLTALDLEELEDAAPVVVPVGLGMGEITVLVPAGVPIAASVDLGMGDVLWDVDGESVRRGGVGTNDVELATQDVEEGTTEHIRLEIRSGMGQVTIEEQS